MQRLSTLIVAVTGVATLATAGHQTSPRPNAASPSNVNVVSSVPISISGTPSVSISGTPSVSVSGTPSVNVSGTPTVALADGSTVAISGTPSVSVSGTPSVTVANVAPVPTSNQAETKLLDREVLVVQQFGFAPTAEIDVKQYQKVRVTYNTLGASDCRVFVRQVDPVDDNSMYLDQIPVGVNVGAGSETFDLPGQVIRCDVLGGSGASTVTIQVYGRP